MRLAIARPIVGEAEARALRDAVRRGEISRGASIAQFERAFARLLGGRGSAAAVSTGTAAVEVAVRSLGLAGEEIATGAMSCQATANALLAAGCRIRFADHDPASWQVSVDSLARVLTPRTRAILAAHLYGNAADLDALRALARARRVVLIEDCAQSLGARWRGRAVGSLSAASAFSFYANKLITTGEGGMAWFSSARLAARARRLRDHGQDRPFHHVEYGLNWKMPNLLAALGLAQMKRIPRLLAARRARAALLRHSLEGHPEILLPVLPPQLEAAPFSFPILHRRAPGERIRAALARTGVETRPLFPPQFDQPYWAGLAGKAAGAFPVARALAHRGLYLSVSPHLSRDEIRRVARAVIDAA